MGLFGNIGRVIRDVVGHAGDVFEDVWENFEDIDFSNFDWETIGDYAYDGAMFAGQIAGAIATGGLTAGALAAMDLTGMTEGALDALGVSAEDRARILAERERQRQMLARGENPWPGGRPGAGSGSSWILPAAIVAGAIILTKGK